MDNAREPTDGWSDGPVMSEKVAGALSRAGLEVVGALGTGADGVRWAVCDRSGTRWAATVIAPVGGDAVRLRNRVARLAPVHHPHLVRVGPLIDLPGSGLVVLQQEVPGADLRTVAAGRGSWSPGEVVTVLVPLAEALAELHGAGLAHGDVSAGNVVIDTDGRPVLVDVVCSDGPTERGTPGFAAPERSEGAGPPGDVYALASLGLHLLGPINENDEDDDGVALRACLRAAACTEQRARPSASQLACDIYALCAPRALRLPEAAVLTQLALRRLAGGEGESLLTERAPRRPRGRHRRPRGRRGPLLAAALVLALSVCTTVVGAMARGGAAEAPGVSADPAGQPGGVPVAGLDTPAPAAAVRLTAARGEALAAGDAARLAQVTIPGSPAAQADLRARALGAGATAPVTVAVDRLEYRGIGACSSARVAGAAGMAGMAGVAGAAESAGATLCVRVLLVASVTAGAGSSAESAAAPGAQPMDEPTGVVLVLRPTLDGWRVSEVEPAAR